MQQINNAYLVAFKQSDSTRHQVGFDVCLAITTLDLPLDILIYADCQNLLPQLKSLSDYGVANIYYHEALTNNEYQTLRQRKFFLEF